MPGGEVAVDLTEGEPCEGVGRMADDGVEDVAPSDRKKPLVAEVVLEAPSGPPREVLEEPVEQKRSSPSPCSIEVSPTAG